MREIYWDMKNYDADNPFEPIDYIVRPPRLIKPKRRAKNKVGKKK